MPRPSTSSPIPATVEALDRLCREKKVGIVAHFYMDAEIQGVLAACSWPHIVVADSLKMADEAVRMAEAGVSDILVLGVDFMSENARAVLDAAGHADVGVYRVASDPIGCSLAESAEGEAYATFLERAAETDDSLHVVYINTSLRTKAQAHATIPTITCTSSNVVQTVLTATAQMPSVSIFYGPDTYMGHNLRTLFEQYAELSDDVIRKLHPEHDQASIRSLLERFHTFEEGACIVHHMFGGDVVRRVREEHADAFHTAHLEVPGEMFALAMEASRTGRGIVGSTSNILGFIVDKAREHISEDRTLSFVLGTEAGMVTGIVKAVQAVLAETVNSPLAIEIVFPVASEAVAAAPDSELQIIPGVASGEGCSVAGGCATCPYMKMNELDGVFHVLEQLGSADLTAFEPETYKETIDGKTTAEVGSQPILHMRHFQVEGKLSQALVDDVQSR